MNILVDNIRNKLIDEYIDKKIIIDFYILNKQPLISMDDNGYSEGKSF